MDDTKFTLETLSTLTNSKKKKYEFGIEIWFVKAKGHFMCGFVWYNWNIYH